MNKIMVVDKEAAVTEKLEKYLENIGYKVKTAYSGEESIKTAKRFRPDLILMAVVLDGKLNGIDAADILKAERDIPFIFMTEVTDEEHIKRVKELERFSYVVKPFKTDEVRAAVELAFYKRDLERSLRESEKKLRKLHNELELKIKERTSQLAVANENLRREIEERKKTEEALRKSEKKYQELFEDAPVGYYEMDINACLTRVNRTALKMLGYSAEEMLGRHPWEFMVERELSQKAFQAKITGVSPPGLSYERTFKRKDGTILPIIADNRYILDHAGRIVGLRTTIQDITRLKQAEELFYKAFHASPFPISISRLKDGFYIDVNKSFVNYFGHSREEVVGRTAFEINIWGSFSDRDRMMRTLREKGFLRNYEVCNFTKSGECRYILCFAELIDIKGEPCVLSITQDVTEKKRVEEALRINENAMTSSLNGIVLTDLNGNLTYVNPSFLQMWGYNKKNDVLGKHAIELWRMKDDAAKMMNALKERGWWKGELVGKKKDGLFFDIRISANRVKDKTGKPLCLMASFEDITARKRMQQAVIESEMRYRHLVQLSPDGICIHVEGKIVFMNSAGVRFLGAKSTEELYGKQILNIVHPDYRKSVEKRIKKILEEGGGVPFAEEKFIRLDGTIIDVEVAAIPFNYNDMPSIQVVFRDISERKQAELKLHEYQRRLRSLASELSLTEERQRRRIAEALHDRIGQALAMTSIKLEALRESPFYSGVSGPLDEIKALIYQSIQHTRSLTLELSPPVLYDLGFEAAVEWLTEYFQEQHGILTRYENDGQPKPLADDVQVLLFQATRELLFNVAKHAQARNAEVSIWKDAHRIGLAVEDNGVGFELSEVESRMNKGFGFGLLSIRERLRHLGGCFNIESEPGRGTRIELMAPLMSFDKSKEEAEET